MEDRLNCPCRKCLTLALCINTPKKIILQNNCSLLKDYFYLDELDEHNCRKLREDSILRLAIIYSILKTEFWKPNKGELKSTSKITNKLFTLEKEKGIMAGGMKFHIRCRRCGHLNRPDNSTRKGIQKVLTGGFIKCRGCGIEFSEIWVPARPMVVSIGMSLVEMGDTIFNKVHIHKYKKKPGCAPRGYAF